MSKETLMAQIQSTPSTQISELEFVKNRYVENYNLSHKSTQGDLMYHRQQIFFNQQISANQQLAQADKFSLYACFVTAAVNGYSFDPNDNEVYLVPRGGKAYLDRQAGAHVRRLIKTNQIRFAEQAKLVYRGDIFEVENGRVLRHVEKFESSEVIAGYVRFVVDANGTDRFFVYRKSDFEAWRKKSPNPKTIERSGQNGKYLSESPWDNGVLEGTEIEPGFLRTKIVKHACKEKCWATGSNPAGIEQFTVEVDIEEEETPLANEHDENAAFASVPEKEFTNYEDVQTEQEDEDAF